MARKIRTLKTQKEPNSIFEAFPLKSKDFLKQVTISSIKRHHFCRVLAISKNEPQILDGFGVHLKAYGFLCHSVLSVVCGAERVGILEHDVHADPGANSA